MRILIAEDEPWVRAALSLGFSEEGFSVVEAADGVAALERAAGVDLVVLDWMMPKASGLDVLRSLRAAHNQTPVLMLTVRDEVADRTLALNEGADDYLQKPFAFEELLARVRAILRRSGARGETLRCADLTLDRVSRAVARAGQEIKLTSREYHLLLHLLENKGRTVSRAELERAVWGPAMESASNLVDVYVRHLRQKIDEPCARKLIHTTRGAGYALREDEP